MTLKEIVEQLRSCGYVCEAGPLENNVAFVELVKMAEDDEREPIDTRRLIQTKAGETIMVVYD